MQNLISDRDLLKEIEETFRSALEPDPVLTVSQWAEEHRILPKKTSSESGKWSNSRTPYLTEIMDCLSVTHPSKKVVFMKASQVGGTECGNNWIGYIVDHVPGPVMMVLPRKEDAERNSKLRIEPLFEETPRLKKKVSEVKAKDSSNTILHKDFPGGAFVLTGANSPAGLRSMPARFLMLDEIDGYPHDVGEEGSPIDLVLARSRTFSRRKAFLVSTPTIDGASMISDEFELSDKRYYNVPCPHCGKSQTLKFENLKWPEGKTKEVLYYCEHCGEGIEERYKTKMLARGTWIATAISDIPGFHLNSLYSPLGWFSWADIAEDYEKAKKQYEEEKKTAKMKVFYNTILGLTFKEDGEQVEWKRLHDRRETYRAGIVPEGGLVLTAGVDVQKDRLEMEVVAWGIGRESWSVDYVVIPGDTSKHEVWDALGIQIERNFETETGQLLPIKMVAVDSGYNTQEVYKFCKKYSSSRVIPVKGREELIQAVATPKAVDIKNEKGKVNRRGMKVWGVGVNVLKQELYGWLKIESRKNESGLPIPYCHFPQYDEEYFKQLCAEKLVMKKTPRGFVVHEWVKTRERNEALDARIYARACSVIIGIDKFRQSDWEKFIAQTLVVKKLESTNNEIKESKQKRTRERRNRGSGFW